MDKLLTRIKELTRNCPYYQTNKYISANSIKEMPIITRYDVINNYDQFVYNKKPLIYTQTSGSNGMPLRIAWNYHEYLKSLVALWRLRAKHGVFSTDFQLTCHSEFDAFGNRIEQPIILFPNVLSLSKIQYSRGILQKYIQYIEQFRPTWILAQPSFVYLVANYLLDNKPELLSNFKYIELVGELLSEDIKKQIQAMFPNATVVNMYGMQEFNGIMYEEDGIMKAVKDNVFIEIVDEFGKECKLDQEGDIVITGLQNSAFPLVRYNTKDRGKKVLSENSEGYIITVGRANDQFEWENNLYDGSVFFTLINEYTKRHKLNVLQFQVVYSESYFTIKLLSTESLPPESLMESDLKQIIFDIIKTHLPIKVRIALSTNEFIKCGNKIKYFINKNKI